MGRATGCCWKWRGNRKAERKGQSGKKSVLILRSKGRGKEFDRNKKQRRRVDSKQVGWGLTDWWHWAAGVGGIFIYCFYLSPFIKCIQLLTNIVRIFWQIVPYAWGKLKPNEALEPPPKTTARTIEFRGVLPPAFTQAPGLTRRIPVQKVLHTVLRCKRWHSQKAAIHAGFSALWQQITPGNRNIHSTEPWKVTPERSPEGREDGPTAEQLWVSFAMELLQDEPFFSSC